MSDIQYMQKAIQLALKAKGKTSPNPLVGAVVVKNNKIIAQGWHKKCGSDHAEISAFKNASVSLKGASLYVNLEPCCHYGRTPPCVDEIIRQGIKEVIIAMKDPNPLINGKSIATLKKNNIKVKVGILENVARAINPEFIKFQTTGLPFVTAKSAQTLDGKIAAKTGDSKWITSGKTREFARKLRDNFDAILVGINTVLKDDPSLNAYSKIKKLKKIVLDSKLRISPQAKLFDGVKVEDVFLAVTKQAPKSKIEYFLRKGINVIICPEKEGKINLIWLFKDLAKKRILSILIEGGAEVIGSALKDNLVDKMNIYIAPKILGDNDALSSVSGVNTFKINNAIQLNNLTLKKIGEDIFINADIEN